MTHIRIYDIMCHWFMFLVKHNSSRKSQCDYVVITSFKFEASHLHSGCYTFCWSLWIFDTALLCWRMLTCFSAVISLLPAAIILAYYFIRTFILTDSIFKTNIPHVVAIHLVVLSFVPHLLQHHLSYHSVFWFFF